MVSPQYTPQRRTSVTRAINPIPYRADYFRHKLHIDQNEKLLMYMWSLMLLQLMDTVNLQLLVQRCSSKTIQQITEKFISMDSTYFPFLNALADIFECFIFRLMLYSVLFLVNFLKYFLMLFTSLSQPFIIRNRRSYIISDLIMGRAFLRDSETSENSQLCRL